MSNSWHVFKVLKNKDPHSVKISAKQSGDSLGDALWRYFGDNNQTVDSRVGYAFNIYPFLWPSKNGPSQTEAQVVMDRPLAYINLPIREVKKVQQQFALQFTPPIIQLFRHFVEVVNCST